MMSQNKAMEAELDGMIEVLQDVKKDWITKVPGIGTQINKMLSEFHFYRDSMDQPASVMIMGRTGAGKSSFINALVDDSHFMKVGESAYSETKQVQVAEHVTENGTKLAFLDTRGGGEGDRPDSEALRQIREAADEYDPRVVFVLMPPDRSHWDEDLAFFTEAVRSIYENRKSEAVNIEVVGIVTKMDTIVDPFDPARDYNWRSPQTKSEEKIADWCNRLKLNLEDKLWGFDSKIDVFPVCTRFGLNDDGEEVDLRWGLDEVMRWLANHAPFDLLLKISDFLKPDKRRELAVDLVHRFAVMSGIVGAVPIPFADAPVLAYLQYVLVRIIYSLAHNPRAKTPKEYFSLIGGTTQFIGKVASRQLVGALTELIPGWGSVIGGAANATIAAGFTEAFGHAAILYYFDEVSVTETISSIKEIATTLGKKR
jgi:predicted GTPase